MGPLLNGGSSYLIEKETLLNPDALAEEMFKNKITTMVVTAALFTHLAESRKDIFSTLKYLLVGGDVLSPAHAK